jgi:hypothetical protein
MSQSVVDDAVLSVTETTAVARAEVMLAIGEHLGINLEALAFVSRRFATRGSMLDAAEPARRAEIERLMFEDFTELAGAFKLLAAAVKRGGEA